MCILPFIIYYVITKIHLTKKKQNTGYRENPVKQKPQADREYNFFIIYCPRLNFNYVIYIYIYVYCFQNQIKSSIKGYATLSLKVKQLKSKSITSKQKQIKCKSILKIFINSKITKK